MYDVGTEHVCNTTKCKNCKEMVGRNHRCYVQTIDLPRRKWQIVTVLVAIGYSFSKLHKKPTAHALAKSDTQEVKRIAAGVLKAQAWKRDGQVDLFGLTILQP